MSRISYHFRHRINVLFLFEKAMINISSSFSFQVAYIVQQKEWELPHINHHATVLSKSNEAASKAKAPGNGDEICCDVVSSRVMRKMSHSTGL